MVSSVKSSVAVVSLDNRVECTINETLLESNISTLLASRLLALIGSLNVMYNKPVLRSMV